MAIEKPLTSESQIALTLIPEKRSSHDELCLFRSPSDSLGPPPSKCVIIIDDDEEEETLESRKKKKPRLDSWWEDSSWWEDDGVFNELSSVVKGSKKPKHDNDIASRVNSCCDLLREKKKDYQAGSSSTVTYEALCVDENVGCENTTTSMKGNGHVSLEELGVSVEDLKSSPWETFDPTVDPWIGGYIQDMLPPP